MNDSLHTRSATRQSPIYVDPEFTASVAPNYFEPHWPATIVVHPRTGSPHPGTRFSILAGAGTSGGIRLNNHLYILRELHFHAPSEHIVNHEQCEGEVHLVHQSPMDGRYAVVAVLLRAGAASPTSPSDAYKVAIKHVVAHGFDREHTKHDAIEISPKGLLPESREFFRYQGSLTTEPFAETVSWIVMSQPIAYDDPDLATLANRVDDHARPIQDRDRRIVVRCQPQ